MTKPWSVKSLSKVCTLSSMSEAAQLRIGELARRTGVATELLRAWERRYGLLSPTRTEAGYRLYSAADVSRVRRMRDLLATGLSAKEAAGVALDEPVARGSANRDFESAELREAIERLDDAAVHTAFDSPARRVLARRRPRGRRAPAPTRARRRLGEGRGLGRAGALRLERAPRAPARPRPWLGPRRRPARGACVPAWRAARPRAHHLRPRAAGARLADHVPRCGHALRHARGDGAAGRPGGARAGGDRSSPAGGGCGGGRRARRQDATCWLGGAGGDRVEGARFLDATPLAAAAEVAAA